ncbi:hypothetical protein BC829DRAFT_408305 [Chytridium lagenaria]|nr:hypothetical protein BC829DRAFT_408305 [Chytridium lagenaria]
MKSIILSSLLAFAATVLAQNETLPTADCPTLVGTLQTAAEGSNFISESDFPWIPFLYQNGIPPVGFPVVRNFARIAGLTPVVRPISSRYGDDAATDFIAKRIASQPENANLVGNFTEIFTKFNPEGVDNLRYYKIYPEAVRGEIFIVGRIPGCGLLGIRTTSIET